MVKDLSDKVKVIRKSDSSPLAANEAQIFCINRKGQTDISCADIQPGMNWILAVGKNDYYNYMEYSIEAYAELSNIAFQTKGDNFIYSRAPIMPEVQARFSSNGEILQERYEKISLEYKNTDGLNLVKSFPEYQLFSISGYEDNVDAGTGKAILALDKIRRDESIESAAVEFNIVPRSLSTLDTSQTTRILYYDDSMLDKIEVHLKHDGYALVENTDYQYSVSYAQLRPGVPLSLEITGMGNYKDVINSNISVYGFLSGCQVSDLQGVEFVDDNYEVDFKDSGDYAFDGFIVKLHDIDLELHDDYEPEYPISDKYPGLKTVRLDSRRNYLLGYKEILFKVIGDMSQSEILTDNYIYVPSGQAIQPLTDVSITFYSKTLKKNDDYVIQYRSDEDYSTAGQKSIDIIGANFYRGQKTFSYWVFSDDQTLVFDKNGQITKILTEARLSRSMFTTASIDSIDSDIAKIVIGHKVQMLEDGIFKNFNALEEVDCQYASNDLEIPAGCFENCIKLKKFIYPNA